MTMSLRVAVVALSVLLIASAARASESTEGLAEELVRLRGEVEQLSAELEIKKEENRSRLRSLTQQRTDLELEIQRETLRLKQIEQAKERHLKKMDVAKKTGQKLVPVSHQAAQAISRGHARRASLQTTGTDLRPHSN